MQNTNRQERIYEPVHASMALFGEELMFSVPCPHCHGQLSLSQRKGLLVHAAIFCIYCAKPIKIKETSQFLNSITIGVVCGILFAAYTNYSTGTVILLASVISLFFQRYLNILYSLEPAENEDLM